MDIDNNCVSTIIVTTEAEFIHRYMDAPAEVRFLRDWHRHMLKFNIEIAVNHFDRELEFIMVKRFVNELLTHEINLNYVDTSCENICKELISKLIQKYGERWIVITASEDGENAGKVYYNPPEKSTLESN